MFHTRFRTDGAEGEVEDRLASFLPILYPESAPSCVGQPGQRLVYSSSLFGDLALAIPDYSNDQEEREPEGEGDGRPSEADVEKARRLFAHYLWGSALLVTDGIERAARRERENAVSSSISESTSESTSTPQGNADDLQWSVKGHRILEVGAGVALPSITSALAGAESVVVSDHPSAPGLFGPIQSNIRNNLPQHLVERVAIQPYQWGVFDETTIKADGDELESRHVSKMAHFAAANKGRFSRVICADCLWMPAQHENLIQTLLWFLTPSESSSSSSSSSSSGMAWVVAGLHTGREIVANFFRKAVAAGLVIDKIWERDMNATEEMDQAREWGPVREDEGPENRARWCVVAMLRQP
ncbi:uncharacterized protein GIQ15_01124 [Arthroderma uncinatum]|uniref:uncharacterized protein n=1 Tax=Arthroderma uncinatum TaxID=74035 RepID=UPI00144AD389|nr:uncharacterized protein GIQ15_01124 [Arthroderma uncinatum]KAF3491607.1 hypothetical protein GIQ15_01124 [Arthroderma uncinatum]